MICLKELFTGRSRFSIIKERARYYEITMSAPLFGHFEPSAWYRFKPKTITVLAFNYRHAVQRAYKRGFYPALGMDGVECAERWGALRVKPAGKPDNHNYIKYFK